MKRIELTKGYHTIVDDEDYERLLAEYSSWRARVHKNGAVYAYGKTRTERGKGQRYKPGEERVVQRNIQMHRIIMGEPEGLFVDHIDGDGLNNQKYNLRTATQLESAWNRGAHRDGKNKYKGVYKNGKKYMAQLWSKGVRLYLGLYEKEDDAARAYNKAALQIHGEFARLNDIK